MSRLWLATGLVAVVSFCIYLDHQLSKLDQIRTETHEIWYQQEFKTSRCLNRP